MIALHQLRVAYGRTVALFDVDLEFRPGITGLFGPNGSGKSTLLRAVAGLLRPTRGEVTFRGAPVGASDEEWRRRLGYAGHQPGLYDRLTVAENLELFARLYGADRGAAQRTLEAVGLEDRARQPVGELSAGYQRRVGVARALVHDPEVLLLDEPYANLDEEASELISDMVKAWRRDDRVALIATHGAKRLKAFADSGVILQRGRVATARAYTP